MVFTRRSAHSRSLVALCLLVLLLAVPRRAHAAERLKVLVPEKDNLTYLVLWTAKAGGYFEREDVDIEIVPARPRTSKGHTSPESMLDKGEVDAALLAPPAFLRMVANKNNVVLVANLFRNDPTSLVVRPDVLAERKISVDAGAGDRVRAMKGMKVGISAPAYARFKKLVSSHGLDMEKDLEVTTVLAPDQASSFASKKVDALFVTTPALETSVAASGGVVLVDLARGDMPEFANRQTILLGVSKRVNDERPAVVASAVRAIAKAESRMRRAPQETIDALVRQFPDRDKAEITVLVGLFTAAVPESAEVRSEDLAAAAALIPEGVPPPDLTGIDLSAFVAKGAVRDAARTEAAASKEAAGAGKTWLLVLLGAVGVLAVLGFMRMRAGKARVSPDDAREP